MFFDVFTPLGIKAFRQASRAATFFRGDRARPQLSPPEKHIPHAPTPFEDIENSLQKLRKGREKWFLMGNREKAAILTSCLERTVAVTEDVVKKTIQVKGAYDSGSGEERLAWGSVIFLMREYVVALKGELKPRASKVRTVADQTICQTFPTGLDRLVFLGVKGEVWLEPGATLSEESLTSSLNKCETASIWLILGAGNQAPAVLGDILHCLFMQNTVAICKMNPVNDFLGAFVEEAFKPLIEQGFLQIVYGAAAEGVFLCNHDLVDEVHMTGSSQTFNAIVWQGKPHVGPPPFKKKVHGELGCVTPYIIIPGKWNEKDIDFQARQIVSGKVHNAGHNCLALEVIVTPKNWPQKEKFMERFRFHLNESYNRVPWYPGSDQRYEKFLEKFPDAEVIGGFNDYTGVCPWVFAPSLTPDTARVDDENWCGVMQNVDIEDETLESYLNAAAEFCNLKCFGNLSCATFVDPVTYKQNTKLIETFIGKLKYGTVAVNLPTLVGFGTPSLTWGPYPGNTIEDISSGNTMVHNSACINDVQKSVVYGPWQSPIYPVWLADNMNIEKISAKLIPYFADPTLKNLMPLAMQGLIGAPTAKDV